MAELWKSLDRGRRMSIAAGGVLVLALTAALAWWTLRSDYRVLFADLKPQDTAAMVAELDRMKVPYKLGTDGNSLLVEEGAVHTTRMKLMGKEIPLHGTAGFELFNNGDFGMTEFAQKVNYQRALQGEITRTILSLAEVRDARVHLALAEEGLFKRSTARAKAAITLTLRQGRVLRPEQVAGIQRLVAASVPGVAAQDVTIIDQQGVALTRSIPREGDTDGSARLDLKKETEQLLSRKATEVLERALGAGQAMASVDVTLNLDQVRVTTEDVLGAAGRTGAAAGVMVREREVVRDAASPEARGASAGQREVEYQAGRRVEQVVSQPGAVRRLQVVAVVRRGLDDGRAEQVKAMVAAAVGAQPDRGDTVVVQSIQALGITPAEAGAVAAPATPSEAPTPAPTPPGEGSGAVALLAAAVAACTAAFCAALWLLWHKPAGKGRAPLDAAQREAVLLQVQAWLAEPSHSAGTKAGARPAANKVLG